MAGIDPVLKQDLHLVREAFENGADTQSGKATFLPFRTMVSSTRQAHQVIQKGLGRYPAVYAPTTNSRQGLIDKLQHECIPCSARIRRLGDVDIMPDLDLVLGSYNTRTLKELIKFFKNLKGLTPIDRDLCQIYAALKDQCVPDLQRLVAALTMLLSDLRSIDLKLLKKEFKEFVFTILSRLIVSTTMNLDKYTRLITDTIRCMAFQLKEQIAKVDPILSAGGRANAAEAFRRAWNASNEDKNWLRSNQNTRPVYNKPVFDKIDAAATAAAEPFDKLQKANVSFSTNVGGRVTEGVAKLQAIMEMCAGRVELKLDLAIQELLKLLKFKSGSMEQMNALMEIVQSVLGVISIVQALASALGIGKFNPCGGPEEGRQFFNNLVHPNRRIEVVAPDVDAGRPIDDVDIVITDNPVTVDSPVVRDVLQRAGIGTRILSDEENRFVVDAEPLTFNFFACMKQTLGT